MLAHGPTAADANATVPTFAPVWCIEPPNDVSDAVRRADAALCAGDAAGAAAKLAAMHPSSAGTRGSRASISLGLTYFYALLAAREDATAASFLRTFVGRVSDEREAEFWAGRYADSLASYLASDTSAQQNLRTLFSDVPDDVRRGHFEAAVPAVHSQEHGCGDECAFIAGAVYATGHDWPDAFEAWISAANQSGDDPPLDVWSRSALEMLYHYREHAPKPGAGCGSPADIAAAETAAISSEKLAGRRYVLIAAAPGNVAQVQIIVEKGTFVDYFRRSGSSWIRYSPPMDAVFAPYELGRCRTP
jgi:hypothetical protein